MSKATAGMLIVQTDDKGCIFSYVRQTYLTVLVNEYGFRVGQMKEEESVVGRGSGQARIAPLHSSGLDRTLVGRG